VPRRSQKPILRPLVPVQAPWTPSRRGWPHQEQGDRAARTRTRRSLLPGARLTIGSPRDAPNLGALSRLNPARRRGADARKFRGPTGFAARRMPRRLGGTRPGALLPRGPRSALPGEGTGRPDGLARGTCSTRTLQIRPATCPVRETGGESSFDRTPLVDGHLALSNARSCGTRPRSPTRRRVSPPGVSLAGAAGD